MESKKNLIIVLGLLVVLIVMGYFLMGKRYTAENPRVVEPQQNAKLPTPKPEEGVKEIYVTAKSWQFEPSTIKVKLGDKVRLRVKSVDVDHGFSIPEFRVNMTLKPNRLLTTEFVADKKGEFTFFCSVYCGSGHKDMKGKLIVE